MVAAYRRMAELMPDNGIQVIMFTHQSGAIWADMANIVWASGLQVTAVWYVVTETDSALREGSHVKGTVLLVVRKRRGTHKIGRGDLAWEIQEEVEAQVQTLTGLNQQAKGLYRDENLFEDADVQMAGYAAALRVLTRYAIIDGRDMATEALRPRVRGQTTFVDDLIEFAVSEANRALVPAGIAREHWERLLPAERFYLKLIELEARGPADAGQLPELCQGVQGARLQAVHGQRARQRGPAQGRDRVRPLGDGRDVGALRHAAARGALRADGAGEERGRRGCAQPPDAQLFGLPRPARAGGGDRGVSGGEAGGAAARGGERGAGVAGFGAESADVGRHRTLMTQIGRRLTRERE